MSIGNLYRYLVIGIVLCWFSQPGCSRKTGTTESATGESPAVVPETQALAGIATINVNKVASDSGTLDDIKRELHRAETEFNLILAGLRKIHFADLGTMEKKYGDQPTEAQEKEIQDLRARQASEYNLKWQETRIKLNTIKQKLDERFLAKVQPLAKKVAKQKGLSVVIRQENVFCLVEQYDITEAVSAAFQKNYPREKEVAVTEVAEVPSRGGEFVPRK